MNRKIIAITTGISYVDKTRHCVKSLKIGRRKDGQPFWYVMQTDCNFTSEYDADKVALGISNDMSVPFFFSIKHGMGVTKYQIEVLKKYDVIV